jgi:hypothetical protein
LRQAKNDPHRAIGNLAHNEVTAAQRAIVVDHYAIAGEQAETLAVIHRQAMREDLGGRVRAGGMEGGLLVLQRLIGTAEHFTGPGLEVAGPWRRDAQRFQHVCGANRGDLSGQ